MAKQKPQVTFDFSPDDESPKEFFSGQPVPLPKPKSKRGRKSLKDPAMGEEIIEVPDDEVLFRKAYYSMGEVARMFKTTYAQLRYWDSEFDILQPRKTPKGTRHFRAQDVKTLVLIHDLIRRRKFTVEGAREYLKMNAKAKETHELIASLQKIRAFLMELKASL